MEAAGLLFDMDGVLGSSIASVNRCWRRWAEHYGLPDADKVQIAHGTRAVDIIRELNPGLDVAEGLRLIEDMEIEDVADLKVLPGARELLSSLPPERWAIVTSATYRLLLGRLRAAELPVPQRIVSGDRVTRGKPDPEPYRLGAQRLGFAARDCLVFEDAPSGVQAGVAAGARVVGVLGTTPALTLQQHGASWLVPSLAAVHAVAGEGGLTVTIEAVSG